MAPEGALHYPENVPVEHGIERERVIRLRYAGSCRVCGSELPPGTRASYHRTRRTVRCLPCGSLDDGPAEPGPIENVTGPTGAVSAGLSGTAGASARREHERRRASRTARTLANHPRWGRFLIAVTPEPQPTAAWAVGARGEERMGARLDAVASSTLRVLHDRRIPGSRANIDHIVVCPGGVAVIDTKRYQGRPELRTSGGLFRAPVERLVVGRRDCTQLVDGVLRQVDLVRSALVSLPGGAVPVVGMLCFVEADWPLIGGSFSTRGVHVLWPRRACKLLGGRGDLTGDAIAAVYQHLGRAFPSA